MSNLCCWDFFFNDNGEDCLTLHQLDIGEVLREANDQGNFMYCHYSDYNLLVVNLSNMTYAAPVVCLSHPIKKYERKKIKDS